MRARNIKPGFFTNEDLIELPPLARLLFLGLTCFVDRRGRCEDRPKKIKIEVLPGDDCDIDALLTLLAGKEFIDRYEVDGKKCIQVAKFLKHQKPHSNEAESEIPPKPKALATKVESTCDQGAKSDAPRSEALRPESLNDESLNDESLNPAKVESESKIEYDPLKANAAAERVVENYVRTVSDNGSRRKAVEAVIDIFEAHPRRTEADLNAAAASYLASTDKERKYRIGPARFFADEWQTYIDGKHAPPASNFAAEAEARAEATKARLAKKLGGKIDGSDARSPVDSSA